MRGKNPRIGVVVDAAARQPHYVGSFYIKAPTSTARNPLTMKFVDTKTNALFLASLTLTAAADCVTSASPGQVNDPILSSVDGIKAPLSTLNDLINNWKDSDGLAGALGIQQSYYPLFSAVISLSSAVQNPPTIASNNVVVYVNSLSTLVADISTLIETLNQKANSFNSVGAGQIVVGDITSLAGPAANIEASFFAGIPSDAPCEQKTAASSVADKFSAAFAAAAETYSIQSGISAFPQATFACASYCAGGGGTPPSSQAIGSSALSSEVGQASSTASETSPATSKAPPATSEVPSATSEAPPVTSAAPPVTSVVPTSKSNLVTSVSVITSAAVPITSKPAASPSQPAPSGATGGVDHLIDIVNSLIQAINNMDSLVTAFKKGIFSDIKPLIKLQNTAVDLGSQIDSITKEFNATAQLSAGDTLKIATPFTNLIKPLQTVLSDIGKAKPQFDKAILDLFPASCLIKGQVVHLQQVSDKLIAQVKQTIDPGFGSVVDPLAKQIDDAFNEQINTVYKKDSTVYIPFKL